MFDFTKRNEGNVVILSLNGQLDALTAGKLKPFLDEMIEDENVCVVYDLQQLSLIDSSGVGVIVSTFKRTRAKGGDTRIACIMGQPKEVFQVLNLNKYIDICDTVENAVEMFPKS